MKICLTTIIREIEIKFQLLVRMWGNGNSCWRKHKLYPIWVPPDFPCGSAGEEFACNARDLSWVAGLGGSCGEGKDKLTPVFWPGEFHGQMGLAGYSPWGCKKAEVTEQLSLS